MINIDEDARRNYQRYRMAQHVVCNWRLAGAYHMSRPGSESEKESVPTPGRSAETVVESEETSPTASDTSTVKISRLRKHQRWLLPLLTALLTGQMMVALSTAANQQSATYDEPAYIGAAMMYVKHHSLQMNYEHPPLTKLLSGVSLSFTDVHLGSYENPENIKDQLEIGAPYGVGYRALYEEGNNTERVLLLARLPTIVLTVLFGLVVLTFAWDLFGAAGGLFAFGLYSFSPDVIAHGSLATNDLPVAGFLLTTVWLLWRSRTKPIPYLVLAGLAYGCALAMKLTALSVFPVVFFLVAVIGWQNMPGRLARAALRGRPRSQPHWRW
ncbi:MAG: glycosyltransferase family 39 protein, partial [Longispora sp.]|nr:glycosyltransferase family 39 protein [Longispora sp. (in: high G+C Gram-positive bacteria)]